MRANKVCGQARCPHLEPCPDHPKVAWAGSTRRKRLPGNWETLRRTVLSRDPVCQACGDALAVEVDHILPGDDHSVRNLQGICKRCHREKTQAEATAARRTA